MTGSLSSNFFTIMNMIKKILLAGSLAILSTVACHDAKAQGGGLGSDLNGPNRIFLLSNTVVSVNFGAAGTWTNQPMLTRYMDGIAVFSGFIYTNAPPGSGTNATYVGIQTSKDTTNWNSLTNYAVNAYVANTESNYYYGITGYTTNTTSGVTSTNGIGLTSTNFFLLPSTNVTPNAVTSGFGTSYKSAIQYTNLNPYYTNTTEQFALAWSIRDQGPYVRVIFGGNGTNIFGGILYAHLQQ